jgi:dihydrolipoamide dehydrogenase
MVRAGCMPGKKVEVTDSEGKTINLFRPIMSSLPPVRSSRQLDNLKQDGKKIIGYRQALVLDKQPGSMVVVGSGAIGAEFAYFYNTIGTNVTLVEYMPTIIRLKMKRYPNNLNGPSRKSK